MEDYKLGFLSLALKYKALKFGEFTLKSGRLSPYFFNAGLLNSGESLARVGQFYAEALMAENVEFDMVFGPAYKGIPLVSSLAIALAEQFDKDIPYSFNRKEVKKHGEKGLIVGAPLKGRVVIVDDVITAGTAIREALSIINDGGGKPTAVLIGLDRQERGQGETSAIQELEQTTGVKVISIVKLDDIIRFLEQSPSSRDFADKTTLDSVKQYRERYGV